MKIILLVKISESIFRTEEISSVKLAQTGSRRYSSCFQGPFHAAGSLLKGYHIHLIITVSNQE